MGRPTVCVLLSTYNGAAYLPAQLDSLKAQEAVYVLLHVRDDGSTDQTLAVLAQYADIWPNLANLSSGPNLKPAGSFLDLLRTAPEADFYAFCDQDDVWLPDKLARAVSALHGVSGPALYCSLVKSVTENLDEIGIPSYHEDPRLLPLLFHNIAFGCTTVLNPSLRDLIISRPPLTGAIIMHDWWAALVASAFGVIYFDRSPTVLYRQHGGNAVGASSGGIGGLLKFIALLLKRRGRILPFHSQAAEFLRLFGPELSSDQRRDLERLVKTKPSLIRRIAYAVGGPLPTRGRWLLRGLILAGFH